MDTHPLAPLPWLSKLVPLAVAAALIISPLGAPSQVPQPGLNVSPFGSQIVWPDNADLTTYANHLSSAGVQLARSELIWWSLCEPTTGSYQFVAGGWNAYQWIQQLKARNIKPYCILSYGNSLHGGTPDTPAGRAAFGGYVNAVVSEFRQDVDIWEIWNEPNLASFWGKTPNAADYTALVAATAPVIRAADAHSIVVAGATSGIDRPFLDACFDAGLLSHIDVLSVHPYRNTNPESVNSEISSLRAKMNTYPGGAQVKIWAGEWGYNASWSQLGSTLADREINQAKVLQRMMVNNLTQGIVLTVWFSVHGWLSTEDWGMTKWNSPATTRQSHQAMRVLQERLPIPLTYVGNPLNAVTGTPVSGLRLETFQRSTPAQRTVVVWRPRPLTFPATSIVQTLSFNVPPTHQIRAYDGLSGAEFFVDARWNAPGGTVTIHNQPLYDYPLFFEVDQELPPLGVKLTQAQVTVCQPSTELPGGEGLKALDGVVDLNSKWVSANIPGPHTLTFEWTRPYAMSGFVLRHPGLAGEFATFNAEAALIEVASSLTGPWTVVGTISNPLQRDRSLVSLPSPVTARCVRLTIQDLGIDNYARLPEFEVYVDSLGPAQVADWSRY